MASGSPGTYPPLAAGRGGRQVFPRVPVRQLAPPAWGPTWGGCPVRGYSPSLLGQPGLLCTLPASPWVKMGFLGPHLRPLAQVSGPTDCRMLPWPGTMLEFRDLVSTWRAPPRALNMQRCPDLVPRLGNQGPEREGSWLQSQQDTNSSCLSQPGLFPSPAPWLIPWAAQV